MAASTHQVTQILDVRINDVLLIVRALVPTHCVEQVHELICRHCTRIELFHTRGSPRSERALPLEAEKGHLLRLGPQAFKQRHAHFFEVLRQRCAILHVGNRVKLNDLWRSCVRPDEGIEHLVCASRLEVRQ